MPNKETYPAMSDLLVPLTIIVVYGAQWWVVPAIAACIAIRRRLAALLYGRRCDAYPPLPTYVEELEAFGNKWDSVCESHNGLNYRHLRCCARR
jgi:hypothetical protein